MSQKFDLWLADWTQSNNPARSCGLWQYTSEGKVPGISGNVDLDYAYFKYPDRMKFCHCNGY